MTARRLALAATYVGLVVGGWLLGGWLAGVVEFDVRPQNEPQAHQLIMGSTVAYVIASALPFVPGAEIGLALMLMLGARIVPLVYVSMLFALSLAYLVGRRIPARATAAAFGALGLERARTLVLRLEPLEAKERLALLVARAPRRVVPFLLRHRYVALAVALNVPGNTVIGGGGGIALAAGMSGLFPVWPFLATLALAVAPVPLAFLVLGLRG